MAKKIQAIRGMKDILPKETPYWQHAETIIKKVLTSYGYEEIRLPLIEHTDLFIRSIGEITDIVEKEMYTFADRNGESLTLRPEGTAGCVRAGIEHGLLHNQIQRFWYQGPMFRHERPQKGRYRQFHQCGIEAFGLQGPEIDGEMLLINARIWRSLGIEDKVFLELNSLGNIESHANYRCVLADYFKKNFALLDNDSVQRLSTNPLRILDSKNPAMQSLIEHAPKLLDHLDSKSQEHFTRLRRMLDALQIKYEINPRLVRGLDYYCLTVFEWVTRGELGAQNAICGGGHYDSLVAEMGGRPTPAIGCAIGLERLVALLQNVAECKATPDIYLIMIGEAAVKKGFILAENLRSASPNLRLMVNCDGGNWSRQLKRADQSGAKLALILAEHEVKSNVVTLKYLREEKPQQEIKIADLALHLPELIK